MKAITFNGPRSLSVSSVPEPRLEQPTDVLVRVELTAVCGSDLHVYRGHEQGLDAGTVLGHEFLGEVIEVGQDASLKPGTSVVAPFTTSCGACFYCERGLTSRCEKGQLFGWLQAGAGLQGGQCEYVRVPLADTTLVEVPAGLAKPVALFAGDIYSTGSFCAAAAGVDASTSVVVIGCGPVGLMGILAAQQRGATRVFAIDGIPERLALAASFGADAVSFHDTDVPAYIKERTDGRGVDAVLEIVGSPAATRLAYEVVRPGGAIAAAGVHTEAAFAFSPGEAYDKNITYSAGRCSARHFMESSLRGLQERADEVASIITHELPISAGVEAYEMFDARRDGCVKVLLRP